MIIQRSLSNRLAKTKSLYIACATFAIAGLGVGAGCASNTSKTSSVSNSAAVYDDVSTASLTASDLLDRARKSLVVVRYVFDGEAGRREFEGVGTVVAADGTTMTTIGLFPSQMPDVQITGVKIVIPPGVTGDDELEIDAEFVGRDERADVAFVRPLSLSTTAPSTQKAATRPTHTFTAMVPASVRQPLIGETVMGVGLLPKGSGYGAYLTEAKISSILRGPVPQVLVAGQLPVVGAPVFDRSGNWVGFVQVQEGQIPLLNNPQNELAPLLASPIFYVPAADFVDAIADLPKSGVRRELPHLGIGQMTGLSREVAQAYGIDSKPAIQIGDVPPGFAAANAGLKSGDIIVSVSGKPLERGDLPEELPMILVRRLQRANVGDTVVMGVVREPNGLAVDMPVTLGARPPQAGQATRYFADDLGFASRDIVYDDRYRSKLDAAFVGIAIAFVKPQSAAQAGGLRPGDLVTRLNQTPVTSISQFKTDYQSFRKASVKEAVVLEVQRGVDTQIIRIEPPR